MPFSSLPMLWFDNMMTLIIAITEHITWHQAFLTENLLLSILLPVKKSESNYLTFCSLHSTFLITRSARTSGFWRHKRQTWKYWEYCLFVVATKSRLSALLEKKNTSEVEQSSFFPPIHLENFCVQSIFAPDSFSNKQTHFNLCLFSRFIFQVILQAFVCSVDHFSGFYWGPPCLTNVGTVFVTKENSEELPVLRVQTSNAGGFWFGKQILEGYLHHW